MSCDKITNQQIKSNVAYFKRKVQAKMTIRNFKNIIRLMIFLLLIISIVFMIWTAIRIHKIKL
jgi:cell division protein FtsX